MGYNIVIVDAVNKEHIGHCDGMYSRFADYIGVLNSFKSRFKNTTFKIENVESWDKNNKLISDIKGELK